MLEKHRCLSVFLLLGFILSTSVFSQGDIKPNRFVKNNTILSDKLPAIKIAVNKEFKYVGRFPFTIRDVAGGERFIFVDEENCNVKRMFIVQFEGFFPHIDDYYRYSFTNSLTFGSHKYRHNPYAYSTEESIENNPQGESALTTEFLLKKGYKLEDELMMYRYLTVPDKEKKNELILYYLENVSGSEHKLADFYKDDNPTEIWKTVYAGLQKRSLKSFEIKE